MQEKDKGRILIADDDQGFREVMATILRREGYTCDCVEDGETATTLLSQQSYDLVIADIKMPGNNNLEFVHELPNIVDGIPVLLVTGHPTLQTAMEAVQLPVVGYITKPFNIEEFLGKTHLWVNRHRIYEAVRSTKQRLQEWSEDLSLLEQSMDHPSPYPDTDVSKTVVLMTLRNITSAIVDMERLVDMFTSNNPDMTDIDQLLVTPKVDTLRTALKDAVSVLEKTKQSFKSKEIAQLRRKLQAVLDSEIADV